MKGNVLLFLLLIATIAFSALFLYLSQERYEEIPVTQQEEPAAEPETKYTETRMLHFGDVMLGRGVGRSISAGVNPFEHISGFIQEGRFDEVVANLEGPFTHSEVCQKKPYSFRFDPAHVFLLVESGITGVSLANNHSDDCYLRGVGDTRGILDEAGIRSFGDDAHSLERGSVWVSEETGAIFLGFDMTMRLQSVDDMSNRIRQASETGNRVVVHVHWGNEYELVPDEGERDTARLFAESGASLIIGHHPHVVQGAEILGDTAVFYSLGNFVFDQDTLETQTGYAVEERVTQNTGTNAMVSRQFVLHPYRIIGHRPTLLDGAERTGLCDRILEGFERNEGNPCMFALN